MIEQLPCLVNDDDRLVRQGRYVTTTFLFQADEEQWLVHIDKGRVDVETGPFVMPRWTFALRASAQTWQAFWSPAPRPGFHDIMAMIRFKTLTAEGDLYPLMSNLLWFKEVLGRLRGRRVPTLTSGGSDERTAGT